MASDHECPECGQDFKTDRRLRKHRSKAHGKTPMTDKRKLVYAGVGLLAVGLVAGLVLTGGGGGPASKAAALEQLGATDDPHLGNESAPVAVVAFEAPSCPSCRAYEQRLFPSIKSNYIDTGKTAYYFSQYTIRRRYDEPGSVAQQCVYEHAGDEAFFTVVAEMYDRQGQLDAENTDEFLRRFSGDQGWDADAIVSCYKNRDTADDYRSDLQAGEDNGVSGTPYFFVVGHDGKITRTSASELGETIQQEYERAQEG